MTKEKTGSAKLTRELEGLPKKRGRPFTGKAKSSAERQAEFRQRQAAARKVTAESAEVGYGKISTEELCMMIAKNPALSMLAWVEIGRRQGWLK